MILPKYYKINSFLPELIIILFNKIQNILENNNYNYMFCII